MALRRAARVLATALAPLLACVVASASDPGAFDRDTALARSQAAIGARLGDHRFVDARGKTVRLSDLRGRPLLISPVFTSCHHTCPTITKNLQRSVRVARDALGEDRFAVATLGFDWQADTPHRMASFARQMGIDVDHWLFLSGDESSIRGLLDELGFVFAPSPRGFDHLAQTTVVDADGRVYWQVYGASFDPPHLIEPLKRLVFSGRHEPLSLAAWIEGVKFFCTVYDPASGRYRFDYSIVAALLAGVLSLGTVAVFIVRAWRQSV